MNSSLLFGKMKITEFWILVTIILSVCSVGRVEDVKKSELYGRIKTSLNAVPAIDTHEHLRPFDQIPGRVETPHGLGMTLHSIWSGSYLRRTTRLSSWPKDGSFKTWWESAQHDFDDARATSFYRYMLPAFRDLYGVDFDTIAADEASNLSGRIFDHYKDDKWLH